MQATVWWKNGKHDTFCDIGGVSESSNPAIIYIVKENGDTVFVNVKEILFIEEESE